MNRCSATFCPFPATRQSYNPEADETVGPWDQENYLPWCAGHAPRNSWPLEKSEGGATDDRGREG